MTHAHPDTIRGLFSKAMSDMYRVEVPHYGTLIDLVREVNEDVLYADPNLAARLEAAGEMERLDVERHGAIRLGTAEELFNIRRMFAIMGMEPVGYYDLSVAGLPVHSTAFRPVTDEALSKNPFRVFTSLIRLELLEDRDLAAKAEAILSQRQIFTDEALGYMDKAEAEGGLSEDDAKAFVAAALETFRWHEQATVTREVYEAFLASHRLIADVVCFAGPHINHLTPRTLDIDRVQALMPKRGIDPKAVIEGPPKRRAGILLRQTSFKALEESIAFDDEAEGTHTARFGEIEQRGVALTPKGRALYDTCLAKARAAAAVGAKGEGASDYEAALEDAFSGFADRWNELLAEDLAYFRFMPGPAPATAADVAGLVAERALIAEPQTYEDFLPVSAAGIFQSNLGSDEQSNFNQSANRTAFEAALGAEVADEMALYAARHEASLKAALAAIGR